MEPEAWWSRFSDTTRTLLPQNFIPDGARARALSNLTFSFSLSLSLSLFDKVKHVFVHSGTPFSNLSSPVGYSNAAFKFAVNFHTVFMQGVGWHTFPFLQFDGPLVRCPQLTPKGPCAYFKLHSVVNVSAFMKPSMHQEAP